MSDQEAKLRITEIFHSIQGESSLSGKRFSFIRLTGCPLRCTYCDTTYSYSGGKTMLVSEIVSEILTHQTQWICITGGEPLVQKNTLTLVQALIKENKKITIETDGEEDVSSYIGLAKIIMDIKTPGSGEKADLCFKNLQYLLPSDEIKFVLCNKSDYEWAREVCKKYDLENRFEVLFSASFGAFELKELAELVISDRLNIRIQTQLHKHIWGTQTKGV